MGLNQLASYWGTVWAFDPLIFFTVWRLQVCNLTEIHNQNAPAVEIHDKWMNFYFDVVSDVENYQNEYVCTLHIFSPIWMNEMILHNLIKSQETLTSLTFQREIGFSNDPTSYSNIQLLLTMHIVLLRWHRQSAMRSLVDRYQCCKSADVVSSELYSVSSQSSFQTDLLGTDCKRWTYVAFVWSPCESGRFCSSFFTQWTWIYYIKIN